jgi:hypothetical protein
LNLVGENVIGHTGLEFPGGVMMRSFQKQFRLHRGMLKRILKMSVMKLVSQMLCIDTDADGVSLLEVQKQL